MTLGAPPAQCLGHEALCQQRNPWPGFAARHPIAATGWSDGRSPDAGSSRVTVGFTHQGVGPINEVPTAVPGVSPSDTGHGGSVSSTPGRSPRGHLSCERRPGAVSEMAGGSVSEGGLAPGGCVPGAVGPCGRGGVGGLGGVSGHSIRHQTQPRGPRKPALAGVLIKGDEVRRAEPKGRRHVDGIHAGRLGV